MIIRPTEKSDFSQIEAIYKKYHENGFGLPSLRNSITDAVVVTDEKVIAFGYVKLFAEAIMVLDLGESRRNKIFALQNLMVEAIRATSKAKLPQLHSFIQDEHFAKLMIKHYDFRVAKGQALVLNLE